MVKSDIQVFDFLDMSYGVLSSRPNTSYTEWCLPCSGAKTALKVITRKYIKEFILLVHDTFQFKTFKKYEACIILWCLGLSG